MLSVLLLASMVAVVICRLLYTRLCPLTGSPFSSKHVAKTPAALETDRKKRDAVLKQGFKMSKVPENLDVIVVGSGIGGLTTAVLLSRVGYRVLVLEQHDQAGGCCHTFVEQGFEFDVGIHYIGGLGEALNPLKVLIDQLTGGNIEWAPMHPTFDTVVISDPKTGGRQYPITTDGKHIKASLYKMFPDDKPAVDRLLARVRRTMKGVAWSMIIRIAPRLLMQFLHKCGLLDVLTNFFKDAAITVDQVLSDLATDNQDLKAVAGYLCGDHGCLPDEASWAVHAMVLSHFYKGGYYPVGGASQLAFTMIPQIERAGGKVLVRAPVTEILFNSHGKASGYLKHIDRIGTSRSSIQLFIGLNGTAEELGLQPRNYWFYPDSGLDTARLRGLVEGSLEDAMQEDAPFFISFPSAKDPSWEQRYPGKSTCVLITLANYDWFKAFENGQVKKRGDEYEGLKNECGRLMLQRVYQHFPQLDGKVEYFEVGSPVSNNYYIGSSRGEVYGLDHSVHRFNPEAMIDLRADTDIPGLYLAGTFIVFNFGNNHYIGCSRGEVYGLDHSVHRFNPEAMIDLRADTDIPGLYLAGMFIV